LDRVTFIQRFFMTKIHLFAILALFSLNSCKSNYALFQESSQVIVPRKIEKKLAFEAKAIEGIQAEVAHSDIETEMERVIPKVPLFFKKPSVDNPRVIIPKFVKEETVEKMSFKPGPTDKEKRKKQRKRRNFWRQIGSNMLIGVVFLGVAVVMSIIHLQTLALLFGIASILFLIFGLKKIFKKRNRRIRNPFK
jgi:hypothetical protein